MQTTPLKLTFISISMLAIFACAGPSSDKEQASDDNANPKKEAVDTEVLPVNQNEIIELDLVDANVSEAQRMERTRAQLSLAEADTTYATTNPIQQSVSVVKTREYKLPVHAINPHSGHENYQDIDENPVKIVSQQAVSTFSVDVDTGSYTNTRRQLNQGYLPPKDAVRIEEFINYFDYEYTAPDNIETPFSVNTAVSVAPWNKERHILRIGLKGYEPNDTSSKHRNLVFLIDVSGSMKDANKLPLLKRSLSMLSHQLNANDSVSIVVYAGASGVVLEPTTGDDKNAINNALEQLGAGGSTNGASGIQMAYQLAEKAFKKDGINRVILATDGDFNVGMADQDALIELIEAKREKGIALTTLGFGQGNYNDYLMEQLADAGNGNYAYIDNINEARKVLVDELHATMQIIAKDVKIQLEFNPKQVAEYRLIGYENRQLANEDFNNDKVDAGDIGAGHRVTALYELSLVSSKHKFNDELRYQQPQHTDVDEDQSQELAFVKLRYKMPGQNKSKLIEQAIMKSDVKTFAAQDQDFKFATAVAVFAQILKKSKYVEGANIDWVKNIALENKGNDAFGYRSEFVQLVRNASELNAVDKQSVSAKRQAHAFSEN